MHDVNTTDPSHTQPNHSEEIHRLSERELLVAHVHYENLKKSRDLDLIGWYELQCEDGQLVSVFHKSKLSWANIRRAYQHEGVLLCRFKGDWYIASDFENEYDHVLERWLDEMELVTDWRDVLKRYDVWKLRHDVTHTVSKGGRSSIIFKIARTLHEKGASEDEIVIVLMASKCFQSKWGSLKKAREEAQRIMGNMPCINDDGVVRVQRDTAKFRGPQWGTLIFELVEMTTPKITDSKGILIPTVMGKALSEEEYRKREQRAHNEADAVLIAMYENEDASIKELAITVKGSEGYKSGIWRVLKKLEQDKLVRKAHGTYVLTDKGLKQAKIVGTLDDETTTKTRDHRDGTVIGTRNAKTSNKTGRSTRNDDWNDA